jgi:hypothetical protein
MILPEIAASGLDRRTPLMPLGVTEVGFKNTPY